VVTHHIKRRTGLEIKPLNFHVLTIFPSMFDEAFQEGVVGKALGRGLITLNSHDLRNFAQDQHRSVDNYTFGGGPGMLMSPGPLFAGVEHIKESYGIQDSPVILLTPQGKTLNQVDVEQFSTKSDLILICGRYEGVDERVRQELVTHEVSIGDYVLSGGELASMVLIDAVSRLVPGVVGSIESTEDDSFSTGLLQFPQYTRPAEFRGHKVPDVLVSGHHSEIAKWRRRESLRRTLVRRPDLLDYADLTAEDREFIDSISDETLSI